MKSKTWKEDSGNVLTLIGDEEDYLEIETGSNKTITSAILTKHKVKQVRDYINRWLREYELRYEREVKNNGSKTL